jgi:endonuclease YncB( thermonuclease family)
LRTPVGEEVRQKLKRNWLGKNVHCDVQTRDTYGRVVAKVKVKN